MTPDDSLVSMRTELLGHVKQLSDRIAPSALPSRIVDAVNGLTESELDEVRRVLGEVLDLDDRTVRDVLGRDGKPVAIHHYQACRAEDAEESWDHRRPVPAVRKLRQALMSDLLGPEGVSVEDADALIEAADAGKRFLFIANHESVFDLTVLAEAVAAVGLPDLADRLTLFVNPKIFNMPFVNFFVCKSLGLIKMPQSPRIAAFESVMAAEDIQRRARHGFAVAAERLAAGDSLAIYPEGLRNEGILRRFARAYLDMLRPAGLAAAGLSGDDVLLVPWAHRGVRTLEAVGAGHGDVTVRFGAPLSPERFFDVVGQCSTGVAGHLAGFLVAGLLPEAQRGVYGAAPEVYVDHPHFRLRIGRHTLGDIAEAKQLVTELG